MSAAQAKKKKAPHSSQTKKSKKAPAASSTSRSTGKTAARAAQSLQKKKDPKKAVKKALEKLAKTKQASKKRLSKKPKKKSQQKLSGVSRRKKRVTSLPPGLTPGLPPMTTALAFLRSVPQAGGGFLFGAEEDQSSSSRFRKRSGSDSSLRSTPHASRSSRNSSHKAWLGSEGRRRNAYYFVGSMAFAFGVALVFYLGMMQNISRDSTLAQGKKITLARDPFFEIAPESPLEVTRVHEDALGSRSKSSHRSTGGNFYRITEDGSSGEAQEVHGQGLYEEFHRAQSLSFPDRLAFWSEFIEKSLPNRKKLRALVEGVQIEDIAPIVPEKFDCTTYVETVAALARSEMPGDFYSNLMAIRYREGKVEFVSRNHFPELDWIPNNEAAHILSDVTQELAQNNGLVAQLEMKTIDRGKWLAERVGQKKIFRALASLSSSSSGLARNSESGIQTPSEILDAGSRGRTVWGRTAEVRVPYIEVSDLKKVLPALQTGMVINFVRKNLENQPVLITHQGIIIRSGDKILLRHASRRGKIRTTEFYPYLMQQVAQSSHARTTASAWPLIGVNLNQIKDSVSAISRRRAAM